MPATYAHFRLGREIRPGLTGPFRAAVEAYPALYSWGLHGPDVLFYHKPFQKTPLNAMASPLHDRSGKWFFTRAAGVIPQSRKPQAALAYTVGCLCHFALDALCHGFVEDMARRGTASHGAIESDLDRALLEADGIRPFRFSLTAHLQPTPLCAGIMAPFYPDAPANAGRAPGHEALWRPAPPPAEGAENADPQSSDRRCPFLLRFDAA